MSIPGTGDEELRSFRLGDWLVEPRLGQISRGDCTVRLRPRAMEVLACLAAAAGNVVSRRQIIDAVWRASFVSDNVVSQVVTELRQALGDDARRPRYIQNVPRRGYRLVARVTRLDERPVTSREPPEFTLASAHVTHPVGRGETVVGRGSGADIRIDLTEVSRRHARIVVEGSTATVEDLNSKNGTFVNGQRISEPTRLAEGDQVQFGSVAARFRFARAGEPTHTAQVVV